MFGRITLAVSAAAILVAVLSGPFGTGALPLPMRLLFWAALIGWNSAKWVAWYRLIPRHLPGRPWAVAAAGAILLNLPLPLEIGFVYAAVGLEVAVPFLLTWGVAAAISLAISAVVASAAPPAPPVDAAGSAEPATAPPRGLAARVPLEQIRALTAEDHYVRVHLAGGERPLILYRFGDALADVAHLDGLQVHRGAWVAAPMVRGARRDGRRWLLELEDGTELPVSARHLPAVRARGWLERRAGPA